MRVGLRIGVGVPLADPVPPPPEAADHRPAAEAVVGVGRVVHGRAGAGGQVGGDQGSSEGGGGEEGVGAAGNREAAGSGRREAVAGRRGVAVVVEAAVAVQVGGTGRALGRRGGLGFGRGGGQGQAEAEDLRNGDNLVVCA